VTAATPRAVTVVWRALPAPVRRAFPAPVRRTLRGNTGTRFFRFVPVSVAAALSSLVANALLLGPAHMTAGLSGGLAAMIGAAVSYVLSRWAWERRGRPDLLRETLPFWVISVCAWVALAWGNKGGVALAAALGLHHGAGRILVAEAAYLLVNGLTFLARFVIFHYVLFAGPRSPRGRAAPGTRPAPGTPAPESTPAGCGGCHANRP
jgi:putative flippase GtrA